ncbi:plasmid-related protein [Pseudacidovorax intermedius]|uniref:plasmid-related protein n=1 Tax=Pseudacidovorax intermedius TaxID=433924 RepID=UPI001475BECD|nr:plasmid-related protein [Pseudacidovorax intermedius]
MQVKDCGMRIRVEKELREAFVQACRAQDRAAADVLRDFMRTFTGRHASGQAELFVSPQREKR